MRPFSGSIRFDIIQYGRNAFPSGAENWSTLQCVVFPLLLFLIWKSMGYSTSIFAN